MSFKIYYSNVVLFFFCFFFTFLSYMSKANVSSVSICAEQSSRPIDPPVSDLDLDSTIVVLMKVLIKVQ